MAAAQTMKYMITRHSTIRSVPLKSSFRFKLLPMIGISQLRNNDGTNNIMQVDPRPLWKTKEKHLRSKQVISI